LQSISIRTVFAGLLLIFALSGAAAAEESGIAVLLFHRFHLTNPGLTTVTTSVFEEQLEWLTGHHYTVILLKSEIESLTGKDKFQLQSPSPSTMADSRNKLRA
jgi:hypothetical protein